MDNQKWEFLEKIGAKILVIDFNNRDSMEEVFGEDHYCEQCNKKGAWYIVGSPDETALCHGCLEKVYGQIYAKFGVLNSIK